MKCGGNIVFEIVGRGSTITKGVFWGGCRAVRYTPLPIAIGMRGAASIPAARASITILIEVSRLTNFCVSSYCFWFRLRVMRPATTRGRRPTLTREVRDSSIYNWDQIELSIHRQFPSYLKLTDSLKGLIYLG